MAARAGRRLAPLLMLASGFAGLGYQIVWTQQCALWLGHEAAAVLAVVAAFFGGLALGAWALGPSIERSPRPVRWYAACELAIALWTLSLAATMRWSSGWLLALTGAQPAPGWQWLVAFGGTFLLLLPATAAMGATLPAIERIAAAPPGERSIAGLYAANTAGAVFGVLAAAFWLVPAVGLVRTSIACAALNLLCALTSLAAFPAFSPIPPAAPAGPSARGVLARLALTGLLGIGFEVLVVRVLSQVSEDTVYTFALLLAVYLVGSAAGAGAYRRWRRGRPAGQLGDALLAALATACLTGTATLWGAERVKALARGALGPGVTAAIVAEAVPALLAFGPATVVMGALFSHLGERALQAGVGFGRALAVNTLGAAAAPVLFGVVAVPALGPKLTLALIGAGYLALVAPRAWRRPSRWVPAGAALALAILAPPLAFVEVPDGGRVVAYQDGVMAAVSVVEDADGVRRLRIDNRQQEGTS